MTIAFVGFSYGPRYQQFLPLYAETVLRCNPDAALLLYVDRKLDRSVAELLEKVRADHGADVRVRESYSFGMRPREFNALSSQGKRALRWLFYDDAFAEFDHIYLGDIDMLMLPEAENLEDAHRRHAESLGLPYSNYLRVQQVGGRGSARAVLGALKIGDFKGARDTLRYVDPHTVRRLSGLHFIVVDDYFPVVRAQMDRFRQSVFDRRSFPLNDEQVLFNLMTASGFAQPPVSTTGPDLDPSHSQLVAFRPHHGIHLGIFRSKDPMASQAQVLSSYVYSDYFESYAALLNDKRFTDLLRASGPLVQDQIAGLDRFMIRRAGQP